MQNVQNEEKAMTDAVEAIARLKWPQLLTLQAQLSGHILNCWDHHQVQIEKHKQLTNQADINLPQ